MKSSLWDDSASHNYNHVLIGSAALTAVAVALHLIVPNLDGLGSITSHVAGEMIAATLAVIIGVTLLMVSRSADQRWLELLGYGAIAAGLLDAIHGITSSTAVISVLGGNTEVSEWISLISRTTLAIACLWAVLSLEKSGATDSPPLTAAWPVGVAVALIAGSGLIATFTASEQYSPRIEAALTLVPGMLFLLAFVAMRNRRSHARYTLWAFTLFLVANGAADGAFMAHSSATFDAYFAAHHIFKLFAYGVLLVGLLAESQRLYRFEIKARQQLSDINDSLNRSNLALTSAGNDLRALNRIGRMAGVSKSVADQFEQIGDIVSARVDLDRLTIAIIHPGLAGFIIEATYGLNVEGREPGTFIPFAGTHYGEVLEKRTTLLIDDSNIDEAIKRTPRLKTDVNSGVRSWLTTPIIAEDDVVGLLMVRSMKPLAYSDRETQFIEQVASQFAGPVSQGRGRRASVA